MIVKGFAISWMCLVLAVLGSSSENLLDQIRNLMDIGMKYQQNLTYPDTAVLVFGTVGSDKLKLIHLLHDPHGLEVLDPGPNGFEFIIRDNFESNEHGDILKRIVPRQVIGDGGHSTVFYDVPDFQHDHSVSTELATKYFLKQVLKRTIAVKMMIVIDYESVNNVENCENFHLLIENMAALILNPRHPIMFVVTGVPSVRGAEEITEELAKEIILNYFHQYQEMCLLQRPDEEEFVHRRIMMFMEALISQMSGHRLIGVLFEPERTGNYGEMEKTKNSLFNIHQLLEDVPYVDVRLEEFDFSPSHDSLMKIEMDVRKILENITDTLKPIDKVIADGISTEGSRIKHLDGRKSYFKEVDDALKDLKSTSDKLSAKQTVLPFYDFLSKVNITIPKDSLTNLIVQQQRLEITRLLSSRELLPGLWYDDLKKTYAVVEDELNWNGFLIYLYDFLTSSNVQLMRSRYDVQYVEDWGTNANGAKGLHINANNWKPFLLKHSGYYELLRLLDMTDRRFTEINDIIRFTLRNEPSMECEGDEATLTGNFILMTGLNDTWCNGVSKYRIFAFDKFIANSHITLHNKKQVVIIANRWEMTRPGVTLVLAGSDATKTYDPNTQHGTEAHPEGTPGTPGVAGGNGGNFFGYSNEMDHAKWFTVDVSGGKGGTGQDGSKAWPEKSTFVISKHEKFEGYENRNGYDAIFAKNSYRYRRVVLVDGPNEKIRKLVCPHQGGSGTFRYELLSRWCCKPDGSAGIGGFGGNPGAVQYIGQQGQHVNKTGATGQHGVNVSPCQTKKLVVDYHMKCWWKATYMQTVVLEAFSGYFSDATTELDYPCNNGVTNNDFNKVNREHPKPIVPFAVAEAFTDYKKLIRDHMMANESIHYHDVHHLYRKLDENEQVQILYTIKDFIYELTTLELQYFDLNEYVDFLPFYDSLLKRMDLFAERNNGKFKTEERKILAILYTSALTKANGLRRGKDSNLVIDVVTYLNTMTDTIQTLGEVGRDNVIANYSGEYQKELNAKIDEADKLINENLVPQIKEKFKKLDESLDSVIEETVDRTKQAIKKIGEQEAALKKLQENFVLRTVLQSMNFVADVIGNAGPQAKLASSIVKLGTNLGDQFILDPDKTLNIEVKVPEGVKNTVKNIGSVVEKRMKDQIAAMKEEVDALDKALTKDKDEKQKKLDDKEWEKYVKIRAFNDLTSLQERLDEAKAEKKPNKKEINKIQADLKTFIKGEKKAIERESKLKEETKANWSKRFERVSTAIDLIDTGLETYKKIKGNHDKIDQMSKAIEGSKNSLKALRELETSVYDDLIPEMTKFHDAIEDTRRTLGTKSHVALDFAKWNIKEKITTTKDKMVKAIAGFKAEATMKLLFDKLIDGMSLVIDIYDRIQTYNEHAKLVTYLGQLQQANFASIRIDDPELQKHFNNLKINIQSNVIVAQYLAAINAFKQSVFPFAGDYLDDYRLPSSIKTNIKPNLTDFVLDLVPKITKLKNRIEQDMKAVINGNDKNIMRAKFNSKLSGSKSLYLWRGADHSEDIKDLFSGNQIYLYADVANGLKNSAIKFNSVNLTFHAVNEKFQTKLDDVLQSAHISMTHMGKSYYRCANEFYSINSPPQSIKFSTKLEDGVLVFENNVYTKLRNGPSMLSPYASWGLAMEVDDPKKLKEVSSLTAINIELIGTGQFLLNNGTDTNCKSDLVSRYYTLEKDIHVGTDDLPAIKFKGPPQYFDIDQLLTIL